MDQVAESTGRDANLGRTLGFFWVVFFFLLTFFFSRKMENGIIPVITDYSQLVTSSQSLPSPCLGLPAIRISASVITGLTLVCASRMLC